jgi:hypothetical protein
MNTPSICLSGVANAVERIDLSRTTPPPATQSYNPVRHDVLVDMIEDKLADAGLRFGKQAHALWRENDARYFGMMQILGGPVDNPEYALMLGIRNSYDMSISAQMLLGANVFLCANMSYSAGSIIGRKHTTHIMRDLPFLIEIQVKKTIVYAKQQDERFSQYKDHKITDARADRLMIQMLRQGAIQSSRFSKLVNEWYEPRFDHGPKRAWRLFNGCTEALKGTPVHDMPKRTLALQKIIDLEAGVDFARAA